MRRTMPRGALVLLALALTTVVGLAHAAVASARPWLGVYTQEITDDLRDGLDLHEDAGVLVNRVVDGGPADRAGVRKGDVIVRFNSRAVESPAALADMVANAHEDQGVALQVLRHGDRQTLTVRLAARPADDDAAPAVPEAPQAPPAPGDRDEDGKRDIRVRISRDGQMKDYHVEGTDQLPQDVREMLHGLPLDGKAGPGGMRAFVLNAGRGRLGVRIESLNADLASALGVSGEDGVLVLQVMDGTPAERAGLRAGDVIVAVEGQDVKDAEGLVKALRDEDGKVSLTVLRKGIRRTVEAELEAAPRVTRGGDMRGLGRMGDLEHLDRIRDLNGADRDDLRKQVDELRQQLRELRHQLEERNHE